MRDGRSAQQTVELNVQRDEYFNNAREEQLIQAQQMSFDTLSHLLSKAVVAN